jgi:hypothetical protein
LNIASLTSLGEAFSTSLSIQEHIQKNALPPRYLIGNLAAFKSGEHTLRIVFLHPKQDKMCGSIGFF